MGEKARRVSFGGFYGGLRVEGGSFFSPALSNRGSNLEPSKKKNALSKHREELISRFISQPLHSSHQRLIPGPKKRSIEVRPISEEGRCCDMRWFRDYK